MWLAGMYIWFKKKDGWGDNNDEAGNNQDRN
jgi:hypothetical protein